MARDAEAEREKRAKIIAAEGEARAAAALGEASDTMMSHPLALQLRNLQTLAEPGVEKNTTVVFPAPLMSAIGELATFLAHESAAAAAGRSAGNGRAYALTEKSPAPPAATAPGRNTPHRSCLTESRAASSAPMSTGWAT
jgi:hypothetical protein